MRTGVIQLAKMEELIMHKKAWWIRFIRLLKSCFEMKNLRPSYARNVLFLDNDQFLDNDSRWAAKETYIWVHSYNAMDGAL